MQLQALAKSDCTPKGGIYQPHRAVWNPSEPITSRTLLQYPDKGPSATSVPQWDTCIPALRATQAQHADRSMQYDHATQVCTLTGCPEVHNKTSLQNTPPQHPQVYESNRGHTSSSRSENLHALERMLQSQDYHITFHNFHSGLKHCIHHAFTERQAPAVNLPQQQFNTGPTQVLLAVAARCCACVTVAGIQQFLPLNNTDTCMPKTLPQHLQWINMISCPHMQSFCR